MNAEQTSRGSQSEPNVLVLPLSVIRVFFGIAISLLTLNSSANAQRMEEPFQSRKRTSVESGSTHPNAREFSLSESSWPKGELEHTGNDSVGESHERIETDRHDFTQSTQVVPRGVAQFEFGYTFFQNSQPGVEDEDTHTTPELMLRYGIRENLELRIRYNHAWQFGDEDRDGSEDLRLGLKTRLADQCRLRPESALELRMTAPTGGDDWSTDDVEFGLDYIYGWRFNSRNELYGSTGFSTNGLGEFGFASANPSENNFEVFTQSFAIGTELTERLTIYNEVFGLFTDGFEDNDERPVFYNIGVDYYLSDDVVFDIRAGTGLNDDAEDFFFGIGGGIRF